jgi:LPS-assembly lipoprotein
MWWRSAAAALLLLAVAACGFRPLYGTRSADPRAASELAGIYIAPLPDRDGQLVRNALLDRLNPKGEPEQPRYRLDVRMQISETPVALQKDETATRAQITYTVLFTLYEGNVALTNGTFTRDFSFDYVNQQYSNISARNDVKRRAADEIATEIRNRMATYFIRADQARAAAGVQQTAKPAQ